MKAAGRAARGQLTKDDDMTYDRETLDANWEPHMLQLVRSLLLNNMRTMTDTDLEVLRAAGDTVDLVLSDLILGTDAFSRFNTLAQLADELSIAATEEWACR